MEITKEERKKANKILKGYNWTGDKEELIEKIVKNQVRKKEVYGE